MKRLQPFLPITGALLILLSLGLLYGPGLIPGLGSGPREFLILVESGQRDALPDGQLEIVASLTFQDAVTAKGHRWLGTYDPNTEPTPGLAEWWDAASATVPPVLMDRPVGGGPIRVAPLPADPAAFWSHLEGR